MFIKFFSIFNMPKTHGILALTNLRKIENFLSEKFQLNYIICT